MPVKVKICGVRTRAILDVAIAAGADYVGLVFFPRSPRHLEFDAAGTLTEAAAGRIETVALTVDAEDADLDRLIVTVRPDWLQLHGSETPERVAAIRSRFGLPVIKAIGVAGADDIASAADYRGIADLILFDAKAPAGSDLPGGRGKTFDWTLFSRLSVEPPFALSGGLDPDNVWQALAATGASLVDVSSGLERGGAKDETLVRRFIEAAKAAGPEPKAMAS
jgi:phosphoribosylanthranilate isomerase